MRTIIYVVVNKDNLIYGVTKDFVTAIEATEKFEEAYGERFYISSATDLDITDTERWVRK